MGYAGFQELFTHRVKSMPEVESNRRFLGIEEQRFPSVGVGRSHQLGEQGAADTSIAPLRHYGHSADLSRPGDTAGANTVAVTVRGQ
jgi:hypothetical protein